MRRPALSCTDRVRWGCNRPTPPIATTGNSSTEVEIHASWGFDLANEAEVASYADLILVGTVVEETGPNDDQTMFAVAVDQWIKGKPPSRFESHKLDSG